RNRSRGCDGHGWGGPVTPGNPVSLNGAAAVSLAAATRRPCPGPFLPSRGASDTCCCHWAAFSDRKKALYKKPLFLEERRAHLYRFFAEEVEAVKITRKAGEVMRQYERAQPRQFGDLHERMKYLLEVAAVAGLSQTHNGVWQAIH